MLLHVRVGLFHRADQLLDLGALGAGLLIALAAAGRAAVGEFARALDEVQPVVVPPRLDVVLADEVQRADQLHAGEVGGMQLGHHGLHLRAPEHPH